MVIVILQKQKYHICNYLLINHLKNILKKFEKSCKNIL